MSKLVLLVALAACKSHEPATHQVTIQGMQFQPASLTAAVGDTVVWTNKDIVPHTVTDKGVFDSQSLASQQAWKHTFDTPGQYEYGCTFHPTMTATIIVQ